MSLSISQLYRTLFGKGAPSDGSVIDLSEHGRVGSVSTGQGFKYVSLVDSSSGEPQGSLAGTVIYSDYQASLVDGAEIDSGWLDMEKVDKVQFSGLASASGMTMTLESRADESQTALSTPVTYNDGVFYLFNIICRQRYMRFKWANNTGSTVTNVSMEIKQTFGSSDKLSVFPVGVDPSVFSQAALVQAIQRGKQPDGDYVNQAASGEAFNTSATLGSDAVYTSDWVDTDGWDTIQLVIATDQISANQGLCIQFTDDTQAGTPTVRIESKYTLVQGDIDRGFLLLNLQTKLDGFRVKYTNGSTAQTAMYLSATLKVVADNFTFNSAGALQTSDFLTEVARGSVNGYEIGTKFGRNPVINTNTTPEDVWNGGSTYTGFPTGSPETVQVFSSDANDTSAGTGARTIRFYGLKSSTSSIYESEDVTMNGTTEVTTTSTWYRINRAIVLTAGSGGENAGTITIRHSTTTANVFVQMPSFNQTTIAAYTVPANKEMLIKRVRVAITRSSGAAGSATITLRARTPGGVFRAIRVFEVQTGSPTEFVQLGGDVLPAGTDVKFRVEDVSDNGTVCESAIEYVLTDSA